MKYLYITLFFLTLTTVNAQRKTDPTAEDIALAKELKLSFPDDDVALNFHKETVSFDFSNKTKKTTVNHSVSKDLINIATRSDIQEYVFYDGESVVENFSFNFRNKKKAHFSINDEAYTSDDLFHNDTRVKYATLDFPVLGYRYFTNVEKYYKDVRYFTKVYFNQQYPVKNKEIRFEIPSWLDVELKELNFDGFDIMKTVSSDKKNDTKIYIYTLADVPAMAKESNAPGPTYTYPHILILPKSHTKLGAKTNIFETTEDLYKWYKYLINQLENDVTPIQQKVAELTKDKATDEAKVKSIYYWVQDNIRYIAFEDGIAGFKPDEAANVFTKRYGDCKGMANLIKHMLKEAGFDARLSWIGTKRIAYNYSMPNLSVDNHMICTLFLDDQTIFLDGTEKYGVYGEYAERIQGKQVLIENEDYYIIKDIPVSNDEFNKEIVSYNLSLNDESLTGNAVRTYKGESKSSILYRLSTLKTSHKEDFMDWFLNKGNSNIDVENINTSSLEDRENDLKIDYDINVKNVVSNFDDALYIDLNIEKEFMNLDLKERKTDYLFHYKTNIESNTALQIPDGYTVDYLPENINQDTDNYKLNISFSKKNNTIVYKKEFRIINSKIEVSDFENINQFLKKLKTTYNDQIILKKA